MFWFITCLEAASRSICVSLHGILHDSSSDRVSLISLHGMRFVHTWLQPAGWFVFVRVLSQVEEWQAPRVALLSCDCAVAFLCRADMIASNLANYSVWISRLQLLISLHLLVLHQSCWFRCFHFQASQRQGLAYCYSVFLDFLRPELASTSGVATEHHPMNLHSWPLFQPSCDRGSRLSLCRRSSRSQVRKRQRQSRLRKAFPFHY